MTSKRALITGVTGQDGAYLTQHLLNKGYEVIGCVRRTSTRNLWRLDELNVTADIKFADIELLEFANIMSVIRETKPSEIYNLGAQSFVGLSFKEPIYTSDVDGLSVTRLLEAIRLVDPSIRFYQASTSEMFGKVQETPQTENTPFYPRSPYGVSKLYAHWITVNYREAYDIHASSGILFNHESPIRGSEFVTRKITLGLAAIKFGLEERLELGNTKAARDWGHARDYVAGIHKVVLQDEADDYVLATGQTHSVEAFANLAAQVAGFELNWEGEGIDRRAYDTKTGNCIISVNPKFFRPAEVEVLTGDASKARKALNWQPETSFNALVEEMQEADLRRMARMAS